MSSEGLDGVSEVSVRAEEHQHPVVKCGVLERSWARSPGAESTVASISSLKSYFSFFLIFGLLGGKNKHYCILLRGFIIYLLHLSL